MTEQSKNKMSNEGKARSYFRHTINVFLFITALSAIAFTIRFFIPPDPVNDDNQSSPSLFSECSEVGETDKNVDVPIDTTADTVDSVTEEAVSPGNDRLFDAVARTLSDDYRIWKGNVVYEESVTLVRGEDGILAPVGLLYAIDEILDVTDSTRRVHYEEGVDYICEDGKLVIPDASSIPVWTYQEFYPESLSSEDWNTESQPYISGDAEPKTGGGYLISDDTGGFQRRQIYVTYRHADIWCGEQPVSKLNLLPRIQSLLESRSEIKIVIYGDSIALGGGSSAFMQVEPYAPSCFDQWTAWLETTYHCSLTVKNMSVSGTTSQWAADHVNEIIPEDPDLVIISFGMNDGNRNFLSAKRYLRNIRHIIAAISYTSPQCEFLMVSSLEPNPEAALYCGDRAAYESSLLTLERRGRAVVAVNSFHRAMMERKRISDMSANNTNHPNDFMSNVLAQLLIAAFSS